MAQRGPYRKGPFPIFSGVEMPPKPSRGAKPHNDAKLVELAASRKAAGVYKSSNEAAYAIACEISELENVDYNALYCRLTVRISQHSSGAELKPTAKRDFSP